MRHQDIRLGVNIDHVATLRQARGVRYPDPLLAAFEAEIAGADKITVHLREDRRHIQDHDVVTLSEKIHLPINLEMAVTPEMMAFAQKIKPQHCCFVPEKREEITTEGGLDVLGDLSKHREITMGLQEQGVMVSFFIDPEKTQIDAARECNANAIELHTGCYSNADNTSAQNFEFRRLEKAAEYAASLGLEVHAGHGLHYNNVIRITSIPQIVELNIGHSIIARGLFVGLREAIREMKSILKR